MKSDDTKSLSASQVEPSASVSSARRAYKKPALRRLGSVRALTLGSPVGSYGDCKGGFKATKGC